MIFFGGILSPFNLFVTFLSYTGVVRLWGCTMIRRVQVFFIVWFLIIAPCFLGLKYIELSSTDTVSSCLDTFLMTESKNISENLSEKINSCDKMYKLFLKAIDCARVDDNEYMTGIIKSIPCSANNLIRLKIADQNGKLIYTSDKYETSDFICDTKFKNADAGKTVVDLISLDDDSKFVGISFFFRVDVDNSGTLHKYFVEIVNPISYIDQYLTQLDKGVFSRFFYIISPYFTRYVSLSGVYSDPSEKHLSVSLGCHLANEMKKNTSEGAKVFVVKNQSFSINVQHIKLDTHILAPKLFAVVAAHSGSVEQVSNELFANSVSAMLFICLALALIALYMSRIFVRMEANVLTFSAISNSLPIPFILYEYKRGVIKKANERASSLLKCDASELMRCNAWELFSDSDTEYIKNIATMHLAVKDYETQIKLKNGGYVSCMLTVEIIDIDGVDYVLCGMYDVSATIEMKRQFENAKKSIERNAAIRIQKYENSINEVRDKNERLEKDNSSMSSLLQNIRVELQTKIKSIMWHCGMLVDEAKQKHDDVSLRDLNKIALVSENILTISENLAHITNDGEGVKSDKIDNCNVAELVQDVGRSLQPVCGYNNSTLSIECPGTIGIIRCNVEKLKRIITNILEHSVHRVVDGNILFKVYNSFDDGNSDNVTFLVRSDSELKSEEIEALCEAAENYGENGNYESVIGINLLTVCKLLKDVNARLTVSDVDGTGSEFTVIVPRMCEQDTGNGSSKNNSSSASKIENDANDSNDQAKDSEYTTIEF